MGEVFFYHLTRSPLETALQALLARALGVGWRVAVRGRDRALLEWLDQKLWLGPEEGFLPHGLVGGRHDADQPVLLTDRLEQPNAANCLMSIDGSDFGVAEATSLARVCVIFDGSDQDALADARLKWKAVVDAGLAAQYWSEESGRWEKKLERPARDA